MQRTDESLTTHSQQRVQEWAEGVYELFKAHQIDLISFVPDGGHKHLITYCQHDPTLHTVVLTQKKRALPWLLGHFWEGSVARYSCNQVELGTALICFLSHVYAIYHFLRSSRCAGNGASSTPGRCQWARAPQWS